SAMFCGLKILDRWLWHHMRLGNPPAILFLVDASHQRAVSVPEFVLELAGMPRPMAQRPMARSLALIAGFEARGMGTSGALVGNLALGYGGRDERVKNVRKTAVFRLAVLMSALDALALALAPHWVLAARAVEA